MIEVRLSMWVGEFFGYGEQPFMRSLTSDPSNPPSADRVLPRPQQIYIFSVAPSLGRFAGVVQARDTGDSYENYNGVHGSECGMTT